MRPSKLRTGDKLMLTCGISILHEELVVFVSREPANGKGRPAKNWIRCDAWRTQDDDGVTCISDYELARRGRLI
jgi:hypothetical protein